MKNLSHFAVLVWVVIFSSCKKDAELSPTKAVDIAVKHDTTVYVYPTGYNDSNAIAKPINLGVPIYLSPQNDIMNASLLSSINLNLQSGFPIPIKHPEFLASSAVNTINLNATSDIYVTIVSTGTGYNNALAYYTYKTGFPPTKSNGGNAHGAMDSVVFIFPNAIVKGGNTYGGLVPGNKVKLGTFKAGTSIGFLIFVNGWAGTNINTSRTKYYAQDDLNPESVNNLKRHELMLYDDIHQLYLFGFEDQNRLSLSCDNDFNDVVFYVTSNLNNSISNANVVSIVQP